MRRFRLFFLLIFLMIFMFAAMQSVRAATPIPAPWVALKTPGDGVVLQGVVAIRGEAKGSGLETVELAFAYPNDENETWFFITDIDVAKAAKFQVEWDTTTITDGIYDLRLKATYDHGVTLTEFVSGVRVRNYTLVETKTPSPTQTSMTSEQTTPLKESVIHSTLTPLPTNPAAVEKRDVFRALGLGLTITVSLFALLGSYFGLKKIFQ